MKTRTLCLFLVLCCGLIEAAPVKDTPIQTQGIRYLSKTEDGVRFQRHREDVLQLPKKELGLNPDKARNTSGGIIAFKTDQSTITAHFKILAANYMGSGFGIFENGELIEEFKFSPKETEVALKFNSTQDGSSLFEIALPSFADVEFTGVDHATEVFPSIEKKVYVALGDSISHGVGQDGYGHKTWPFLLSRKLDMELFNLAVGGGKISVPTAEMLKDWDQIDWITILIGYNDLHFDGKTPEAYREKYIELLDAIRKNHPQTKVVCITPLYTKKPESKTGHTVEQFRAELTALVQQRQTNDPNLFLIKGDTISSEQNLRADKPQDPVHLGVEGAASLADAIAKQIM